ncbi:MAG: Rpn family recombination-promoting nuclease/putative transposase [Azoarcus sp.]|nr:Rpn family recombination-promoting nuclease/putative transposase [Azoarcus sp.]
MEMQVRRHAGWNARSTYYLARTLSNQLKNGDDYRELKPVIGIHLVDFDLFDVPDQALWCFELRDRTQPHIVLTGELQLNVIELRKADRLLPQHAGKLAAWVAWFEHWQEESIMSAITHRPVQQAMEQLKGLSADDEMCRLAFVRERALHDEVSFTNAAREEGRALGLEQ